MRFGSLLVLVALVGCDGGGKNDDVDGDGYPADDDCDDNDKNVNPDASEACDEVDNNCNGSVDELVKITMFADTDGDTFGDASGGTEVCVGTAGYVTDDTDCDDTRNDVNPDASEDCSDVDMNCDGNPTLGATDFLLFYLDNDGDTWGDDEITQEACAAPSIWYTDRGGDCADGDEDINPDASEVCNNKDDDCNGDTDDNATDATTLFEDDDLDTYGDPSTSRVGCVSPGLVENGDDCDDTRATVKPGAVDRCNGLDDDCDPLTDENVLFGDDYYVDNDHDLYGDVLVTACSLPGNASEDGGDCNDNDASINPGALEVCGGGDEDCDGEVDVNASDGIVYFDDNDLDTYGDPTATTVSCAITPPTGYVANGDDCNDLSSVSHPGAPEICDSLDNNCVGGVDESPTDASTWYYDTDDDTFGDPTSPIVACTQPTDTVADNTDCDDGDPTSYPGNIEICDGGIDNDCDPSTDEAFTAVWYRDADDDGFGVDTDTVNGCSPPIGYVQVSGDCDDSDDTVNPTLTPNCVKTHCGTIALSETWKPPLVHRITCDVLVQGAGRPTLTVQAGTQVLFDANTELSIGRASEGRLVVTGTPLNPAHFTTSNPVPLPGQWGDISIEGNDTGSVLSNLVVDSAGSRGSLPGGVILYNSDPRITGLTSTANLGAGLVAYFGAEPLITDSTFTENTGNGIYVDVGGGLSRLDAGGTQGPSFENNVITDNGDRPVTIPGSHADEIDPSNVLSPNGTEEIELLSGVLRFTGTWYDHGVPYVVRDNASIQVEDGPAAQLFVDPNVSVFFGINAELGVGVNAGGSLDTGLNTLFTGTPTVIANSLNWRGVTFGQFDSGSVVADLEAAYGGGNGLGTLYVYNSAPTIERVHVHDSDASGIYVGGPLAAPRIRDSDIVDNDVHGVYVEPLSGVARDVAGPTFEGNLLTGNGQSSVVFPPNFIGELDPSTQFTGNGERVGIHGGTVVDNAIWRKLDDDYEVLGDLSIGGPRNPVVDVDDLVHIYFERDTVLRAGIFDDGTLRVNGTAGGGVLFTSGDIAPGQGDWEGVELGGRVSPAIQSPDHLLAYLTIEYAGGSDVAAGGALEIRQRNSCGPSGGFILDHVTADATSKSGLYMDITSDITIDGLETLGLADGCMTYQPSCHPNLVSSGDAYLDDFVCLGNTFQMPAADVIDLVSGTGNVYDGGPTILDSTINTDVLLPDPGYPIYVASNIQVGGAAAPTFFIDPGVELQFAPDTSITCGSSGQAYFYADQVTFTSDAAAPAPGDWRGLYYGTACATRVTNSLVEYAGGSGLGAVSNSGCCAQYPGPATVYTDLSSYLAFNTIKDSASCGLYNIADSDLAVLNGQLSDFFTTFTGNIGGTGPHCP